MENSEFKWQDNHLGYLNFETCPIRITGSKATSEEVKFDEVRIYDKEIWDNVCQYKGDDTPFAQIVFNFQGLRIVKTAVKHVDLVIEGAYQSAILCHKHVLLNPKNLLTGN